jgi:hypothetical protein
MYPHQAAIDLVQAIELAIGFTALLAYAVRGLVTAYLASNGASVADVAGDRLTTRRRIARCRVRCR